VVLPGAGCSALNSGVWPSAWLQTLRQIRAGRFPDQAITRFCCGPPGRPRLQPAWWRGANPAARWAHNVRPPWPSMRIDQRVPPIRGASHSWLWVAAFLANKQGTRAARALLALESGLAVPGARPSSWIATALAGRLPASWPISSAPRPYLPEAWPPRCHSLRKYPRQSPAQRRGARKAVVVAGSLYLAGQPCSLAERTSATRRAEGWRMDRSSG